MRLDDGLQRLGDQLDRVHRLQPARLDVDVDHRHADLRLLLARQRVEREDADRQRRQQEQRRQRRVDEESGEDAGDAQLHGDGSAGSRTSPALQAGQDFNCRPPSAGRLGPRSRRCP